MRTTIASLQRKVADLEALNRRLKERNEFLHRIAAEKVVERKPNLWIVTIVRCEEKLSAEFNSLEEAQAVFNAEIQNNAPTVLYECTSIKTFVPLLDLATNKLVNSGD